MDNFFAMLTFSRVVQIYVDGVQCARVRGDLLGKRKECPFEVSFLAQMGEIAARRLRDCATIWRFGYLDPPSLSTVAQGPWLSPTAGGVFGSAGLGRRSGPKGD